MDGHAEARPEGGAPARRLPRRRFRLALVVGVLLMAAFLPMMEFFFAGRARTTWPAYAIVVPLAIAAAILIGRQLWARAAGAIAAGAAGAFAIAFVAWFVMLSTFAGCGLTPESASWEGRPAMLHGGLPDGGEYRGHPVEWTVPDPALPLQDADLDARWGRWSLVSVHWGSDLGGFNYYPLAVTRGEILGVYPTAEEFQARRGDVAQVLGGFGIGADEAERVADAMAANLTPSSQWGHSGAPYVELRAAIPVAWGPQPVWDSFCCIAESDSTVGGLGQVQLTRGLWAFGFAVETKLLQGDGFVLRSDAEGRVEVEGLGMDEGKSKAYRQRILRTLGDLNLPQPAAESMHVGGSIC